MIKAYMEARDNLEEQVDDLIDKAQEHPNYEQAIMSINFKEGSRRMRKILSSITANEELVHAALKSVGSSEKLKEAAQQPQVGDLVIPPNPGFSKYGFVKRITDDNVRVDLGGPELASYSTKQFHSPEKFKTEDKVWKSREGDTIWKVKGYKES